MTDHPYQLLPDYTRWSRGVRDVLPESVDPVTKFPFKIDSTKRVATAGSCFAQNISRYLGEAGFSYFVTEQSHAIASSEVGSLFNYGVFSARYGNIYTARQLLQLFDRAFGTFIPKDSAWEVNGRYFDPFRPAIEPGGFRNEREYYLDRERHFAAVRSMFTDLDYFVFTLGLTECWEDLRDGAVYPICPGTVAGTFNPLCHAFKNQELLEVVADFNQFIERLISVNSSAKIILTVSPVPLAATALDRHVLVSTTYSKSVLRVAAEIICNTRADVAYFPSYEIITGNFSRGQYYEPNLRDITTSGVAHVMKLFMQHATIDSSAVTNSLHNTKLSADAARPSPLGTWGESIAELICEESALDSNI